MTVYKITTTNNARRDIYRAMDWEDARSDGLGRRFVDVLDRKFTRLSTTPYIGSVRYDDVRCTSTDVFPYLIHYIVDEPNRQVTVLRVLHTHQKPLW